MSTGKSEAKPQLSVHDLRKMKEQGERIAVLTAYDYLFARMLDRAGIEVVLVGDSLANVVLGLDSTVPVTLDDMIHHGRAVVRGIERAIVVVDLPFMTYQVSKEDAIRNAARVVQETGAKAVKLEGGGDTVVQTVKALTDVGIPVMGHLGFTPQSENMLGGHRVQGRGEGAKDQMIQQAMQLEEAGAFAIVLELVPGEVARAVTNAVRIPTIGIGAGAGCDGQVLVLPDMLGMNQDFQPRFLRKFAELGATVEGAVGEYIEAVKSGEYPQAEHTFD